MKENKGVFIMAKLESITGRIIFGKLENFNDHKIECLQNQLNVCYYLLISRNLEPFIKEVWATSFWFAIKLSNFKKLKLKLKMTCN